MKIILLCNKYIWKYKGKFIVYILTNLFSGAIGIIIPLISSQLVNNLIYGNKMEIIIKYCMVFSVLTIMNILMGFIISYLYIKIQTVAGYIFNKDVIQYIQKVSYLFLGKQDIVYLNQRINNDCNNLIIFILDIVNNVLLNGLTIIFIVVLFWNISFKLTCILFLLVIIYFLVYAKFKKILYTINFEVKESQSHFFSRLNEQLSNIKLIKLYSLNRFFLGNLEESFRNLMKKLISSQKISYFYSCFDSGIGLLTQISIFVIGGGLVIKGDITIGIFIVISNYYSMLLNSIRYFFNLGKKYQDNLVSYNRIMELLNMRQEINGKYKMEKINTINIKDLEFGYEEDYLIFRKFNYCFEKGRIYGIKGKNGTGKTTLLYLIIGLFINDYDGKIEINEKDIKELDLYAMRCSVLGITEQEPNLINTTLEKNILLHNDFNNVKLKEYLNMLGLEGYLNNKEKGMKTIINDKSENISGGEKQKISILRQLVMNPEVMMFDEPTSALDNISKAKFIEHLNKIREHKIIIIISHDNSLDELYDEILELN